MKRFKFSIDEKLLEDLEITSLLEGESISFIIRTVLQDYMNYYMSKNNNNKNE